MKVGINNLKNEREERVMYVSMAASMEFTFYRVWEGLTTFLLWPFMQKPNLNLEGFCSLILIQRWFRHAPFQAPFLSWLWALSQNTLCQGIRIPTERPLLAYLLHGLLVAPICVPKEGTPLQRGPFRCGEFVTLIKYCRALCIRPA